uniref:DUF834 domain-containing protein n=1 Tax=Leersia perrieri TaxID=77586 RepID=A0A0D9XVY7_9ORYZ
MAATTPAFFSTSRNMATGAGLPGAEGGRGRDDPVAGGQIDIAGAEGVDLGEALVAGDGGGEGRADGVDALDAVEVGGVDGGGQHPHAHIPLPNLHRRHLRHPEDFVGRAMVVVEDGLGGRRQLPRHRREPPRRQRQQAHTHPSLSLPSRRRMPGTRKKRGMGPRAHQGRQKPISRAVEAQSQAQILFTPSINHHLIAAQL